MFENFTFDAQPSNVASPLYSPCTIVENGTSPFFKPTLPSYTSNPSWMPATGYATPPPSPLVERTPIDLSFRSRVTSMSSTLEKLTIRERRVRSHVSSVEVDSEDGPIAPLNNVRFQRQVLSRMHVEEAQRRCLADLVADMVATGQGCLVTSSSLHSPTFCDHTDHQVSSDDEPPLTRFDYRKSWTFGATQGCTSGGQCVRAGVQKKPRMRRSLVALSGDRSKRTKNGK